MALAHKHDGNHWSCSFAKKWEQGSCCKCSPQSHESHPKLKNVRFQLILDESLNFDIGSYCADNHLDKQGFIRHLIMEEIYRRQSLTKNRGDEEPKSFKKAREMLGENWKGFVDYKDKLKKI